MMAILASVPADLHFIVLCLDPIDEINWAMWKGWDVREVGAWGDVSEIRRSRYTWDDDIYSAHSHREAVGNG